MTNIRLLACQQCATIEELPDFDGPPEYDTLLSALVEKHKTNGVEHIGALFGVDDAQWGVTKIRQDIVKQISHKMAGGETGLGSAFYDLKNTFQDDAMACFTAHQRNPACSDYKSESKRINPGTNAERKAAGLTKYENTGQRRYVCDFCPVNSLVEAARRKKLGLDK